MDSTYTTYSYESSSAAASAGAAAFFGILALFWLAFLILMIVSLWRVYAKAGKPGWAALIPIYNTIVMLQIAGRPIWWVLLMFVPIFGIWVQIVAYIDFAKSFGKSTEFGILAALVPVVGLPMLAFGKAAYVGPIAEGYDGFMPAPDRAPGATTGQPVSPAPSAAAQPENTNTPPTPPQV